MNTKLYMKLIACFALLTLAVVPFTAAHADRPSSIPLLMVVMEFDGGDEGEGAVYYDNECNWGEKLFGVSDSPASFYQAMSEGSFAFVPANETSASGVDNNTNVYDQPNDGIIHVTLHQPHGAWGAVNFEAPVTRDFVASAADALRAASAYIDFPSYNKNGDGVITDKELSVCFCVAGYEAAAVPDYQRTDIPLLWSHAGMFSLLRDDDARTIDGERFEGYIAIAEKYWTEGDSPDATGDEPLGVVYHELGHALGLPDLYAVRTTEGPWEGYSIGPMSLMDQGGWQYADNGDGWQNIPSALDAWSRFVLGWVDPGIVAESGDYTVSSQLSGEGYSTLIIPTSDPNQYFLVENRQPEGQDISFSSDYGDYSGLVIWHVDNAAFKSYYNANTMNDADHRPAVMCELLDGETELLLYNEEDDVPEACIPSGITVSQASGSGRDMVVHVECGEDQAENVLHLRVDEGQKRLGIKRTVLEQVTWLTQGIIQSL